MMFMSKDNVKEIREKLPVGTKVELIKMDDIQAPPLGTKGIVRRIDDAGNIHVAWENGSSLSLIPGEDRFRIVDKKEK